MTDTTQKDYSEMFRTAYASQDASAYRKAVLESGEDDFDISLFERAEADRIFERNRAHGIRSEGARNNSVRRLVDALHDVKTYIIDRGLPLYEYPDWIRGYLRDHGINYVFHEGEKRSVKEMDGVQLMFYITRRISEYDVK
ncbi:hypothetical protein COU57_02200 [Candidatus Pacearchaeota archaeon CG10_big_fil_rev_8_21_14_0_10_32_14]|nr:MAG: hypothetical protein COU57_02200 [Candidatus Pacearchaeota archaeon CG10_big_fil_rev_8_21_14_0_10_32_14]